MIPLKEVRMKTKTKKKQQNSPWTHIQVHLAMNVEYPVILPANTCVCRIVFVESHHT